MRAEVGAQGGRRLGAGEEVVEFDGLQRAGAGACGERREQSGGLGDAEAGGDFGARRDKGDGLGGGGFQGLVAIGTLGHFWGFRRFRFWR